MIQKFISNLKGSDKLLHSKVGNLIFILIFVISFFFATFLKSLLISIIGLLLIGLFKELYDKYIKKTFIDWYDIIASFIPYPIIKYINKK